jgi:energy-coupling factor transporter ATP-binding protein EcfA2
MELLKRLNDEGTTIIQVTHNEKNAEYGHRVIHLVDGWITDSKETVGQAAKTQTPGSGNSLRRNRLLRLPGTPARDQHIAISLCAVLCFDAL